MLQEEDAPQPPGPVESISQRLAKGRQAFEDHRWGAAHEALCAARDAGSLEPADLWRLAVAAFLVGREDDHQSALQEAHRLQVEREDLPAAARSAFWLGFHLLNRGESARGGGWLGRAARLLGAGAKDHPVGGYLLLPDAYRHLMEGDHAGAGRIAARAAALGERFGEPDLLSLALHLQGRAAMGQGQVAEGLALLDEAMVAVATGELSPHVTGLIYCSVISACRQVYALGRAHEWTAALTDWCEAQPDMVPYAGECRVYRAEILQLHGDWLDAMDEARRASEHLARGAEPRAAGFAWYQQGEVLRLRGEFAAAEEAYRAASRAGREPHPGLALLRMAQGDVDAAVAASRRALAETGDRLRRARLLPAHIEIMLEVGELDEAESACGELAGIAAACAQGVLGTVVAQARGALALVRNEPGEALAPLRQAWREWQALDMPYDAARARVLLARACRALGDDDGAALEAEAARATFQALGARHDLATLDRLLGDPAPTPSHGLTPREREVLALLATGKTNRAIARALFISDKTVARHVSNIFAKLGLSSRSAATAYAYEHDLLEPPA